MSVGSGTVKAVAMLSGGLDSMLAVLLMRELGVELIACNVSTPFCSCDSGQDGGPRARVVRLTRTCEIPLVRVVADPSYVEMVKRPEHGYGRGLNPCHDCRVYTLLRGKRVMEERGARFLVTGEVLGQRPMSRRLLQLHQIEAEAGLHGLVLRPLSARLLPPTIPEREGWVDRERLLDISGRRRDRQLELANALGIEHPPGAGGGCLLTDPDFAAKVQDAFQYGQDAIDQLRLLRLGRHYRLTPTAKLVLGRSESENRVLVAHPGRGRTFLTAVALPGPVGMLDDLGGTPPPETLNLAAALLLRHTRAPREHPHAVASGPDPLHPNGLVSSRPATEAEARPWRISRAFNRPCAGPDVDWLVCRPGGCAASS